MRWLRWRSKKPSKAAKALSSDSPSKGFKVLGLDEDTGPNIQGMLRQRAYKPTVEHKKPIAQWRFQLSQYENIFQVEHLRTAIRLNENHKFGGRPGKIVHLQDGVVMPRNEIVKPYCIDLSDDFRMPGTTGSDGCKVVGSSNSISPPECSPMTPYANFQEALVFDYSQELQY
ncbi:uncharacterized protein ASPGLDRAFT_28214 [Aspergillus glaucus CBS 516.65]|uniref:Uncharacterized protein n=1 Tax=Aspergillus glaucus CBS 516.65 TaxID=1160497 RepID=A0A1L9VBT0_ASPGL|nr:hypothetical protein ASPGLDRAFT_28214 [Aspergillus glaucus CBS 516.65]OJJ81388.1 hypothetical protein ASPGLDRAFT_28214 [Aspergillus glaucus CBS 516.65]